MSDSMADMVLVRLLRGAACLVDFRRPYVLFDIVYFDCHLPFCSIQYTLTIVSRSGGDVLTC